MNEQRTTDASAHVLRMITAYRLSQAIYVLVALGIPELLAGGARNAADLAKATETDGPSLYRLLRAAAANGILRESDGRRFELTELGHVLRADAPGSVAGWAGFIGRPYHWQGWGNLLHSVRTGESGVRHVLGMSNWEYRAQHPEENAIFNAAMTDYSRMLTPAVVATYDFGRFGTIADIAGGHGALLAAILGANPGVRGILFDQPHVVGPATALITAAGVADRVQIVPGSFFESVPSTDGYVMQHILHDWDNARCIEILNVIRKAAPPGARLLVVERLIEGPNEGAAATMSDLNMLVGPGGLERTLDEYQALLASGGWHLLGAQPANDHFVIESEPAQGGP